MKLLRPSACHKSIFTINFKKLYKSGVRGILFDIDNTLVAHGKDCNDKIVRFIKQLKKIGFTVGLISNNNKERIEKFNQKLKLYYISNARKPKSSGFEKILKNMNLTKKQVVFVGDQLFTDILGANFFGIKSILVKPINKKEPLQILIKRKLERIFLEKRCFV